MTEASTEIAVRPTALELMLPSKDDVDTMLRIASGIKDSDLVPKALRGKGPSVFAVMLKGRELGLGLMQSLSEIAMIDGRPALSAHLMLALLRKGGVKIVESETSSTVARIKAQRPDGEIMEVSFTWADAEKITYTTWGEERGVKVQQKLVEKDNWRNYPGDMLWARCVSRLARRLGGDLLAGFRYSTEELEDLAADVNHEPEVMTEKPGDVADVEAEAVEVTDEPEADAAESEGAPFDLGDYDKLPLAEIKEKIPLLAQRDDAPELLLFVRQHEAQGKGRSSILKLIDQTLEGLGGASEASQSPVPAEAGEKGGAEDPPAAPPTPDATEGVFDYVNAQGEVVLAATHADDAPDVLAKLGYKIPEGRIFSMLKDGRPTIELDRLLTIAPPPPTFTDPTADPEALLLLRRLREGLAWTRDEWPDDAERWTEEHFLSLANDAWFKTAPIDSLDGLSLFQLQQMWATVAPQAKAVAAERVPE